MTELGQEKININGRICEYLQERPIQTRKSKEIDNKRIKSCKTKFLMEMKPENNYFDPFSVISIVETFFKHKILT